MIFDSEVLPHFEQHRAAWLEQARAMAVSIAIERGEATIDDVRDVCPPPRNVDPRVMGAVFRPLKEWECVRYEKSRRRNCHNRPIGVFKRKV